MSARCPYAPRAGHLGRFAGLVMLDEGQEGIPGPPAPHVPSILGTIPDMFFEPARTDYDLHFTIGGIHIRVHPLFWLVSLLTGLRADTRLAELLMWVGVVFVSILVHELGHSLAMWYYDWDSRIVLYSFGGLAIPQSAPGVYRPDDDLSGPRQILISLAGPAAGFLLAAMIVAAVRLSGHQLAFSWSTSNLFEVDFESFNNRNLDLLIFYLLHVNIFWGLVNLLPVLPLDGGRVSRELFVMANPYDGERKSLMLSMGAAIAMAVFAAVQLRDQLFTVVLFGYLAYLSYKALRMLREGYSSGQGEDRGW